MKRTILFDLDGTLVDSVPDLTAALNRLFVERALAPFTTVEVTPMVGDGVRVLVERAFAARGKAADEAAVAAFSADYAEHVAVDSVAYRGVAETLAGLTGDGWICAVCTNKPEAAARRLLDALGIGRFFAAVGGGDSFPVRKPDPEHLLLTLDAAGGERAGAIMVGDHHNDVAAAGGAGLKCIFAAWGYSPAAAGAGAAAVAERFDAVPAIAARLLGGAG